LDRFCCTAREVRSLPQGLSRPLLIATTVGLAAAVVWPIAPAQAQFFFGFGAPQQIQTARGPVQLAPGWHVATTPVRTQGGYRVAVRSETGEQRQMIIGANGALSYSRAPDPRPLRVEPPNLRSLQRATRPHDRKPAGVRLANIPPRMKQAITPGQPMAPRIEKAAAPSAPSPTQLRATPPKAVQTPLPQTPSGPQSPGYAHGVPINPLD
jgi:hypothetical protein